MNALRRHHTPDRGASLAEYALLVGLVAVVALGAISFLGRTADSSLERAAGQIGSGPADATGSGGDQTGGDASGETGGGEQTGGDASGGTGGDQTGGDASGGTGGDSTGGDASGGTGGDSSGGAGNEPGSIEPPAPTKSNGTGSATRHGNKWSSEAKFTLFGSDGQPLNVGNAQAQVKVMWTYTSWDGESHTQQYKTTQANLGSDGTVTFTDSGFETKQGHNVTSVSYQIVDVFYYYPSNPPVRWDGERAFVEIDAP